MFMLHQLVIDEITRLYLIMHLLIYGNINQFTHKANTKVH